MEITCRRCQTEYEFDDALVSERGTTVRCTNCGEQFKIYRPASASGVPERWIVHRRDGRELVFTNLRDLQKAITNLQVGRYDELTRGGGPPRALGSIAELEPFFLGRIGPASAGAIPRPPGGRRTVEGPGSPLPRQETDPGVAPPAELPARSGRTGRPPVDGPAAPPPARHNVFDQPTVRAPENDAGWSDGAPMAPTMLDERGQGGLPARGPEYDRVMADARAAAARLGGGRVLADPTPHDARISYSPEDEWFGEPRFSETSPARSRALKWLVVLIVLGLFGMVGATVGRKYVDGARRYITAASHPAPTQESSDAKIGAVLDEGEKSLLDGDLETAKEDFDKASALSERDPRALIDLARLATVRADVDWLRVRLTAGDQPVLLSTARRQLADSAARAVKATDRAAEVAPDDPRVSRLKIDALRLSGDLGAARTLVPRVSSISSQPETAYVLAALDLAEDAPGWPAVVDRLKTAAAGELGLLRARGALVYALVRSGDSALAKSELEKIIGAPRPYPLLAELRGFLGKGAGDAGAAPMLEADAGKRVAVAAERPAAAVAGGGEEVGGDYRALLREAQAAEQSGQHDRADQLYRAALAKNPGDTEALCGLGDVARHRGNRDQARSYYEKVLAENPHYLPALGALADLRWEGGDHAGAAKLYRDVLDTSQSGQLAERAKERVAQFEASGSKAAPPRRENAAPPPSPPSDLPPGVDTSDLPGFRR
jgi:predicted Zn finger-like uncharacterized protein